MGEPSTCNPERLQRPCGIAQFRGFLVGAGVRTGRLLLEFRPWAVTVGDPTVLSGGRETFPYFIIGAAGRVGAEEAVDGSARPFFGLDMEVQSPWPRREWGWWYARLGGEIHNQRRGLFGDYGVGIGVAPSGSIRVIAELRRRRAFGGGPGEISWLIGGSYDFRRPGSAYRPQSAR